ncbi:MAG: radical SAM protein [Candidatus Omnitrophota bacterium]
MKKVLLVNPNYYEEIFSHSKVKSAISRGITPLGLISVAAPLVNAGHRVKIIDLNNLNANDNTLHNEIINFKPDIVGITTTTPLIYNAYRISSLVKKINNKILVVVGGPHVSALPEEVLIESQIDCVVRGEGDYILKMIAESGINVDIPNIYFKKNNEVVASKIQNFVVKDLDSLPFPAYDLLNIKSCRQPKISSRKDPIGYLETSRGCYGRCIFCNKNIHGNVVRMKSPEKVVEEIEKMLELGFKEIQIIDDIFTVDMKRAFRICEIIIEKKLKFPWYPRGGIRVDRINIELLRIMKRAGCYRIPFGVESGSIRILNIVNKMITLKQVEEAVESAKNAKLETECYFMLGNPTENEVDIKKSIDFAIKLNPDYAKFAIAIPLPGTQMFNLMLSRGQIKTKDWEKYNFSVSPQYLYDHDVLSWNTIYKYYNLSHKKFYFRIDYILRMIYKTLLNRTIFAHISAFLKTRW